VAGGAAGITLALPLPEGQHSVSIAMVSLAALLAGLAAWRAPWQRWAPAVTRWMLAPCALVVIAAANHFGEFDPYTYGVTFALLFAWVGLSQPRWMSLAFAGPAAAAYTLPLLAAGRPAGELLTVAVVVPMFVCLGEACAWVATRLRAAEAEVHAAASGIERLLEATVMLGRADTEAEAAGMTAELVADLLGADRVQVMTADAEGSSRFVSRGQRNVAVPLGESTVDAASEPSATGLAVRTGRTVFVADVASSPVTSPHLARLIPAASAAFIPLPGEGGFFGSLVVKWDRPRSGLDPFSQRAAEVLSAEAGRALERTRAAARLIHDLGERRQTVTLLREEQSLLHLLQEVAVAANEAHTVDEALQRVLDSVCAYTGWPVGHAYLPDADGALAPSALWHLDDPVRFEPFRLATERTPLKPGIGLLRGVVRSREPAWIADVTADSGFLRADAARAVGLRAAWGVPVMVEKEVVAVLEFFFPEVLDLDVSLLDLARHVGTQLGRVVERRRGQEMLQHNEERMRAVIETAGDAFIGMDDAGLVTEWNRQAEVTFGWSRREALGRRVADLVIPQEFRAAHTAGLQRFLASGASAMLGRPLDLRARARDGREFPVELTAWSTRVGSSVGLNAFVRDISERKSLEAELIHQALHDPLTGLPNRVLLHERLSHALLRGERRRSPVSVLFLDLDGFKTVNDSLGHTTGDRLLTAVAKRLGTVIRPPDTVARLGGDEFAVLLDETDAGAASRVAERIGIALDEPFVIDGRAVHARASIGVATGSYGEQTADDLITNADLAMYLAKRQGRGGFAQFKASMHSAAVERLELEADLRRGLERKEFFLCYQPVVRLCDGVTIGMEALLRWNRAGGALVSPDEFIPVAEQTGLIGAIGHWVLREACSQAAAWHAACPMSPVFRLSVNLSARQLQDPGLVQDVETILVATGLAPSSLVLEITETALMSEPVTAVPRLAALKALGIKLAVDDFGTGYSSLSYLRNFPVDILKIDRSFISPLGREPGDAAIAHAVVSLGHTLHLRVVAEGIETAAQLAELQAIGCEYGQGYLFARPLTVNAMSVVLADAESEHLLGAVDLRELHA
jgi:diguanylate cyclase (GGDEF)-like protein/PAS domain S-box-containing protein